jgi:hypothetical protein
VKSKGESPTEQNAATRYWNTARKLRIYHEKKEEIRDLSSEVPCEIELTLQKEQSLLCTLVSLDDKISPITI